MMVISEFHSIASLFFLMGEGEREHFESFIFSCSNYKFLTESEARMRLQVTLRETADPLTF
jgi:hypothetical protein